MQWIILKTYENVIDLYILKARLESEGIECLVADEHIMTVNPLYNIAVGGIKLKVRENDVDRSLEVMKEIQSTPIVDEKENEINCPDCGSSNIESGHRSLKGIKGIVSGLFSFFFMLFPLYMDRSYKCQECSMEFKKPKS
jgi:DNA-directed RNA polymerase subunit RPC12/RpoP